MKATQFIQQCTTNFILDVEALIITTLCARAAEILKLEGDRPRALAAAEKALALDPRYPPGSGRASLGSRGACGQGTGYRASKTVN